MTCAKRQVRCYIYPEPSLEINHPNNSIYFGSNDCSNPQGKCPREAGEGYEKCKSICRQDGHAEIVALEAARFAGADLRGAMATVLGHWNVCKDCSRALKDAGVSRIIIEVTP